MIQAKLKHLIGLWDRFFFAPASPLPVALFRIVFALNTLVMYAIRFGDWRFYFTDQGFVKSEWALEILPEFYRPLVALYPATPTAALVMQIVLLVSLAGLMLGYASRAMALVAFVMHLAFLQRNFSIAYGADIVTTFFLFSLIFAESDRALSLRSWLGRMRPQSDGSALATSASVRVLQLQLCIIYGYTGLEKLKGPTWWDGTAVWAVIGNPQLAMFNSNWLRHFPLIIALMTLVTVAWEVYFPVLIWAKPIRKWILFIGVGLHAGIAVMVGLVFFSTAMVSTYFVFLDEATLRRWLPKRWLAPST